MGLEPVSDQLGTKWWCEDCQAAGVVTIPAGATVYEGVELLSDAHNAAGRECLGDLARVRIEVPA
jgi:hypothetical protein